jgi:iduronate 2-sulfatase
MRATLHRWSLLGLLSVSALGSFHHPARSQPDRKLNVLLIAVDDLNTNLGCYGDPLARSPNIDKLASRGVKFERAYCQYPLCNPSRTSILSGRRPDTTRIFNNTTPPRTYLKEVVFLPEYFRQHGYFTARVGKIAHGRFEDALHWDVSESAQGRPGAAPPQQPPPARTPDTGNAGDGGARLSWLATDNRDEEEPDGKTARRIVRLLQENKDKPFFIAAGFHKPHLRWVAPKKYFALHPPEKIKLPKTPEDDRKDIPAVALTRTAGDETMSDEQKRQAVAAYSACVSFTDAQVGIVLDEVDRLKLADKTVVVFWGDHGFHLGEHHGLWRKMTLFEESTRVPLIIAAPGKRAGVTSPRLAELVDLYPTLTQLCGLPQPPKLEGVSLVPLLEDPNRAVKQAAYTVVARGDGVLGRSVRTERYRYTEWGDEKTAELYDHETDPREYTNLARDPRHSKTLVEMKSLLHAGGATSPENRAGKP